MLATIIALNKIYCSYLLIILMLCLFGSYYIFLERYYRKIYGLNKLCIIKNRIIICDINLTEKLKKGINLKDIRQNKIKRFINSLLSITELLFYIPMMAFIIISKIE